jgi:GT2 family glycosyltransferase
MPKVTAIQVYYNHRKFIDKVFPAVLNQTYKDMEFIVVIAGNEDGGKEYMQEKYPQVKVVDPGYNIGFARGHNELFASLNSELFQLVNPDLILEPNYIEEMVKAFDDPAVSAATGKLLQYDFEHNQPTKIIDTTGVQYAKSGRARDRGQHEEDAGQYDNDRVVIAVSGAGPMYRKSALEVVKYPSRSTNNLSRHSGTLSSLGEGKQEEAFEYFDEDFHTYFEDVDLSMRFTNAGFKNLFVPSAVGYHGRGAGSTKAGYKDVKGFVKHHKKFSQQVLRWNYKNHVFLFIKNSPKWYPQFFIREFFYNCYVLVFETATLKVLPEFFRQLPFIKQKRKQIQSQRKISVEDFEKLLV